MMEPKLSAPPGLRRARRAGIPSVVEQPRSTRIRPAGGAAVPAGLAILAMVATLGLTACGSPAAAPIGGGGRCLPPVRAVAWRHSFGGGRLASELGAPGHVVDDVLTGAGEVVTIGGKFAYGAFSKDVEDETVELWQQLAPCRWKPLGRQLTDDDGRARFRVAAEVFAGPGPHTVRAYLLGDRSYAEAKVWIVSRRTPAVLFDIDGTLTTDDGELFDELLGGTAAMRPGADLVARRWAALGYLPVYITGRPYLLRGRTFRWLIEHRFPLGPVFTVESMLDALPTEGHVGEFKLDAVRALERSGLAFHRAYGNADTDICAYARAGIPPEQTYIVGRPRSGCPSFAEPRALPSYLDHLPTISDSQRVR